MIAFLCDTSEAATALAAGAGGLRRTIDGPFTVWTGDHLRIWRTPQTGDAQYAAARLAVRRGAKRLVHFGGALALVENAGELVRVGSIADGSELRESLRLTPRSGLPVIPGGRLPDMPVVWENHKNEGGVAVISLPSSLTNLSLGRLLYESAGYVAADLTACGTATGAAEESVPFSAWKLTTPPSLYAGLAVCDGAGLRIGSARRWRHAARAVMEGESEDRLSTL